MGPKPADERSDHDLFRTELVNLIDQRHELVKLAALPWQRFLDPPLAGTGRTGPAPLALSLAEC
jgi:IS5 family transposase